MGVFYSYTGSVVEGGARLERRVGREGTVKVKQAGGERRERSGHAHQRAEGLEGVVIDQRSSDACPFLSAVSILRARQR